MDPKECQFQSLLEISEGKEKMPPQTLKRNFILFVRRRITPSQERKLYNRADSLIDKFSNNKTSNTTTTETIVENKAEPLRAGDVVRVKSKEEIKATLNHLGRLKGCSFMEDAMEPYLGTVQRVLKPMERFVDERELKVKKAKGLVLLDGVMCQGTTTFGRCDRSCLLFWREEWMEKIDEEKVKPTIR